MLGKITKRPVRLQSVTFIIQKTYASNDVFKNTYALDGGEAQEGPVLAEKQPAVQSRGGPGGLGS